MIAAQITPGPGEYIAKKSDFEAVKYQKKMDEKGTYLSMDNGHLNQKKQLYSKFDKNRDYNKTIQKELDETQSTNQLKLV